MSQYSKVILSFRDRGHSYLAAMQSRNEFRSKATVASRLFILVHGYNASEGDATAGYEAFIRAIDASGGSIRLSRSDLFVCVHWPGDVTIAGLGYLSWPISVASYIEKISVASQCAQDLAAALLRVNGIERKSVNIVAHSLGCRLTCEFLHALDSRLRPAVRAVVLMAAAVPADRIRSGGELDRASENLDSLDVLHSTNDWVLQFGFRFGQAVALVDGASVREWPEAVGWRGRPFTLVDRPFRERRRGSCDTHFSGLRHSRYWRGNRDNWAAKQTAYSLGLAPTPPPPPKHELPRYLAPLALVGKFVSSMIDPNRACD